MVKASFHFHLVICGMHHNIKFIRQKENEDTRESVISNKYLQLKSRLGKFMPLCKNRKAHKTQCINVRD